MLHSTASAEQVPVAYAQPHAVRHMQKNGSIQILRAAAALLVVYTHTLDLPYCGSSRQAHFLALKGFGACGVDIFFAISGFILSSVILRKQGRREVAGDFLMRRFIRIFPIYWVASLLSAFLEMRHGHMTVPYLLESVFLLPAPTRYPWGGVLLPVGWTLIFEMFFYYMLSLNLIWKTTGERTVIRALSTVAALVGLGLITGTHHPILTIALNPINLEFVGGCCIALLFARYGTQRWIGNWLSVLGALGLILTLFTGYGHIDLFSNTLNATLSWQRVLTWGIPAGLLTAGLVFRPARHFNALGRLWIYLGDASYSIYLSSEITLYFCSRLVLEKLPFQRPDAVVPFVILVVVAAGVAMFAAIERPLTRRITRWYGARGVQSAP